MAGTHARGHLSPHEPDRTTAWVVSPHLLVAQAVVAALTSAGAPVDFHGWDTLVRDVQDGRPGPMPVRHVVVVVDSLVEDEVVDEVGELATFGDVRVAVVTTDAAPARWSRLLADERIEVVTMATSIAVLAESIEQFTAGHALMTREERARLRSEWEADLDRQRVVEDLMSTLSPQQMRVLKLLATGRRVHEVAEVLGVAVGTVRSHVKGLRHRLGAATQLEAVALLRQLEGGVVRSGSFVPRPRRRHLTGIDAALRR